MDYFFPKLGKTIQADSMKEAIEKLTPKKKKNVSKSKKSIK